MSNEIVQVNSEIVSQDMHGVAALGTTEQIVDRLSQYKEKIDTVHNWIRQNFEPGIDFGQADQRSTKEVLLKPGAEKACNYFNTRPIWEMDRDTWEMLGKPEGTICYICKIVDNVSGAIIGEGRGAEKVGNKQRDANKAIKIAKKSALIDAALSTFCLSDKFTQDSPEQRSKFSAERNDLIAAISNARMGCESTMTNNQFITAVSKDFIKGTVQKIGQIRALRDAILDKGLYDLETGERIRE